MHKKRSYSGKDQPGKGKTLPNKDVEDPIGMAYYLQNSRKDKEVESAEHGFRDTYLRVKTGV
ncbi:MAG: hypothetical protein DRN37_03340 [Thermoplasmata archaeon]|nr:MAG: hypothetical protein DRN37_03340 [Thermoplasmata archaeon]